MISVNVRHQRYAWQIEMATSLAIRKVNISTLLRSVTLMSKTFICQSQNDYAKLVSLNGIRYPAGVTSTGRQYPEGKVGLHLTCLEVTEDNLNPTRPCSVQTVSRVVVPNLAEWHSLKLSDSMVGRLTMLMRKTRSPLF